LFIAAGLFVLGCAQVKTPTGGEKDTVPPGLLAADPAPFTTSFSSDQIVLEYDEYVNLKNVREQVVISPPMDERPDITLKNNKKIIIDFKEALKENTTYTINFGEAITDYTEGNILEENLFLFSTGTFIDSLEIVGELLMADSDEPCKGCFALLYETEADSAVILEKPYYIAKSNDKGQFLIPHLKAGTFRLYGLDDLNADLNYDRGEAVGFAEEPILISAEGDSPLHLVRLFTEGKEEMALTGVSPDKQKQSLTITLSKETDSLNVRPLAGSPIPAHILRFDRKDSIEVWFAPLVDNSPIKLELSAGSSFIDTVEIRTDRRDLQFDSLFFTTPSLAHDSAAITLTTTVPIVSMDTAAMNLIADSIPLAFSIAQKSAKSYSLMAEWEGGKDYFLTLFPGAVSTLVGPTNDTLEYAFACPKADALSQLNVTIADSSATPKILQLVAEKPTYSGTQITEIVTEGPGTYYFKKMPPGQYRLLLLYDENENGKWDTGVLLEKKQPELKLKHNGILQLRPNWELDVVFEH